MKQTSIEWLVDQLKEYDLSRDNILIVIPFFIWRKKVEQAKEMEKEQVINAHLTGLIHPLEIEATKQAEQYYNETYGK